MNSFVYLFCVFLHGCEVLQVFYFTMFYVWSFFPKYNRYFKCLEPLVTLDEAKATRDFISKIHGLNSIILRY